MYNNKAINRRSRIMLPSRYITKVKTSGKRYNRKKERSTNSMSNAYKRQFVNPSVAKLMVEQGLKNELQPGQYLPEDSSEYIKDGYGLKRAYSNRNGEVRFSHGVNLSYFNVMKQATRMGMLFVDQPIQVAEAISQFSIIKLGALVAFAKEEIRNQLSQR